MEGKILAYIFMIFKIQLVSVIRPPPFFKKKNQLFNEVDLYNLKFYHHTKIHTFPKYFRDLFSLPQSKIDTVINYGPRRTEKFCNCCFI